MWQLILMSAWQLLESLRRRTTGMSTKELPDWFHWAGRTHAKMCAVLNLGMKSKLCMKKEEAGWAPAITSDSASWLQARETSHFVALSSPTWWCTINAKPKWTFFPYVYLARYLVKAMRTRINTIQIHHEPSSQIHSSATGENNFQLESDLISLFIFSFLEDEI